MGTRAQCLIKQTGVYLYQHYDGYDLMNKVVKAVNSPTGKGRQSDSEYLTRIIFCEMVKDNVEGATGYGIGRQQRGDIEYLVSVDCEKKIITEEMVDYDGKKIFNSQVRFE
jgi:hypothetical protein